MNLSTLQDHWVQRWTIDRTYQFDESGPVYVIDTPPPYVDGRPPRITHVLTYTQADITARYRRMCGDAVLFPVGWDDNAPGLARRVRDQAGSGHEAAGRLAGLAIAERITEEASRPLTDLWLALGLSVDWPGAYRTLGPESCVTAQRAFMRCLEAGLVHRALTAALRDDACAEFVGYEEASPDQLGADPEAPGDTPLIRAGCAHPLTPARIQAWQLRTGGDDDEIRARVTRLADTLSWHPGPMRRRLSEALNPGRGDIPISAPSLVGIPVPLWYPLDHECRPRWDEPILPPVSDLPIDPQTAAPSGWAEELRGRPAGFIGEPDVLKPAFTASLTWALATHWGRDAEYFKRTFPMSLRPQGHYIIQSWLFPSMLLGMALAGVAPWNDVLLSGWIHQGHQKRHGPDAAEGPPVSPSDLVARYGSDGVRYWAARSRPGRDTRPDAGRMVRGRRLAAALLGLEAFARANTSGPPGESRPAGWGQQERVLSPLDQSMVEHLQAVSSLAAVCLAGFRQDLAIQHAERLLVLLRRTYVPLIGGRLADQVDPAAVESVAATLWTAVETCLLLFAPFLPFATEQAWSGAHAGSVHRQPWPAGELVAGSAASARPVRSPLLDTAGRVLTLARRGFRSTPETTLTLIGPPGPLDHAREIASDLRWALGVQRLFLRPGASLALICEPVHNRGGSDA